MAAAERACSMKPCANGSLKVIVLSFTPFALKSRKTVLEI